MVSWDVKANTFLLRNPEILALLEGKKCKNPQLFKDQRGHGCEGDCQFYTVTFLVILRRWLTVLFINSSAHLIRMIRLISISGSDVLYWWRHVHQRMLQEQSVSQWRNLQRNLWAHECSVQLFFSGTVCWKTLRDYAETKLSGIQSNWGQHIWIVQNYRWQQSNLPSFLWF